MTPEDLEEFGEEKKEKPSTAIVSGAKTGKITKPKSEISPPTVPIHRRE